MALPISNPPSWALWLSVGASAAGVLRFGWAVISDVRRSSTEKTKEIRLREDSYWFQKVILPACVDALSDFVARVQAPIDELEMELRQTAGAAQLLAAHVKFQSTFLVAKQDLLTKFVVLNIADDGAQRIRCYQTCASLVDLLEDNINSSVGSVLLAYGQPAPAAASAAAAIDLKMLCRGMHIDLLRNLKKFHTDRFTE